MFGQVSSPYNHILTGTDMVTWYVAMLVLFVNNGEGWVEQYKNPVNKPCTHLILHWLSRFRWDGGLYCWATSLYAVRRLNVNSREVSTVYRYSVALKFDGCPYRTFSVCPIQVYFKSLRWRHQMETFSALLAICPGNSPITGEFPTQRPVTRSFDVFFDLRLNKRLSKQWRGWWFEMPSRPLWRHCNVRRMLWLRHSLWCLLYVWI